MTISIYAIKNKINNKMYIGKTNNFQRRKENHINALKNKWHHNGALQKDFNEYGEKNFEFYCLRELEVNNYKHNDFLYEEYETMEKYKTNDERYGYNYIDNYYKRKSC